MLIKTVTFNTSFMLQVAEWLNIHVRRGKQQVPSSNPARIIRLKLFSFPGTKYPQSSGESSFPFCLRLGCKGHIEIPNRTHPCTVDETVLHPERGPSGPGHDQTWREEKSWHLRGPSWPLLNNQRQGYARILEKKSNKQQCCGRHPWINSFNIGLLFQHVQCSLVFIYIFRYYRTVRDKPLHNNNLSLMIAPSMKHSVGDFKFSQLCVIHLLNKLNDITVVGYLNL